MAVWIAKIILKIHGNGDGSGRAVVAFKIYKHIYTYMYTHAYEDILLGICSSTLTVPITEEFFFRKVWLLKNFRHYNKNIIYIYTQIHIRVSLRGIKKRMHKQRT